MAYVQLPGVLKNSISPSEVLRISGNTVYEVLQNLLLTYPTLKPFLFPAEVLSPFVNIYLNQLPTTLSAPIQDDDELSLLTALSGG